MVRTVINFVVSSLELFSVIGFFLVLLLGLIAGAQGGGFIGAIGGLVGAFIFNVMFFGILFLVMQNNKVLKEIRDTLKAPK